MADIIGNLNNRTIVRISHALNFARYDIGMVALDIVYALIAQIKRDAEELDCYHISVLELERVLGRKLNRKSLINAQQELLTEPIVFTKDKSAEPYPWCKTFDLDIRLGLIKIELHPELTKHLLSLKLFVLGGFTEVLKLDSKYSKRMYFIFAQFVALGSFEISVGVLRNILKLPLSMKDSHGNFKKRVLVPSVENITDLTKIRVSYSEIKMGRRITDIKFVVYTVLPEKIKKSKILKKTKIIEKSGIGAVDDWLIIQKDTVIDTEVVSTQLAW